MHVFKEKLKKLKAYLKVWNKEVFGNVNRVGEEMQKRIVELDVRDDENELDESRREETRRLLADYSRNLFKQETIMHQKARQKWLKYGDLNTKNFHSTVKWRGARNELHGILENGQWCVDREEVKDKVRYFFKFRFIGKEAF